MRNIFKLIVVGIRLQQISYCYRWIHVILLTKRTGNKALQSLSLQLSEFAIVFDNPSITLGVFTG